MFYSLSEAQGGRQGSLLSSLGALLSILLCERKEAPPSILPQAQASVTVPHPDNKIPKVDPQSYLL